MIVDDNDTSNEHEGLSRASSKGGSANNKQMTDILLVEDVKISQRIATVALSKARYKVDVASSGAEAVSKYQQNPTRVVLMDIQLTPEMNGIVATRKIRDWEQETKRPPALIFGLTGSVEEDNLKEYQKAGMNGCIIKGKLLVSAVTEAIHKTAQNPNEFFNLTKNV